MTDARTHYNAIIAALRLIQTTGQAEAGDALDLILREGLAVPIDPCLGFALTPYGREALATDQRLAELAATFALIDQDAQRRRLSASLATMPTAKTVH